MALIEWKANYNVGIPAIDAQHRHLVALINELHDAMRTGTANAILGETLNRLLAYTQTHFRTEERLMSNYGYPELDRHAGKHRDLEQKVRALTGDFQAGRVALSMHVFLFLKNWLQHHILGEDQKYAAFIAKARAAAPSQVAV